MADEKETTEQQAEQEDLEVERGAGRGGRGRCRQGEVRRQPRPCKPESSGLDRVAHNERGRTSTSSRQEQADLEVSEEQAEEVEGGALKIRYGVDRDPNAIRAK